MPKRDFSLLVDGQWEVAIGVRWPQPREYSDTLSHTYNRSYILICPECGEAWCRSLAFDMPEPYNEFLPTYCVRERYCASCLAAFVTNNERLSPYDPWHPTYAPGCILSSSRHEMHDVPSTLLWSEQLAALPRTLCLRELTCWARLDLACNPLPPAKEPAPDDSNSNALVTFAPDVAASAGAA